MADIVFEPATWYAVTVRCNTEGCVNHLREWEIAEVYSNAGQPNVQDGRCGQQVEILSATKLDPQPEMA